jgi:hypothetical protein
MGCPEYLAMTAAEFLSLETLPPHVAWMACHFSSYGLGLSNLPQDLPEGSMVIVNDRIPIHGHDPAVIVRQLQTLWEDLRPGCFLLDFQRQDVPETAAVAQAVTQTLPCPVGITEPYAQGLDCPVFLSPVPMLTPLEEYLKPWQGREVWLEVARSAETVTVTADGAKIAPALLDALESPVFADKKLHCRYHTSVAEDRAVFSLQRDTEQIPELLEAAKALGVTQAVGLYQQLGTRITD